MISEGVSVISYMWTTTAALRVKVLKENCTCSDLKLFISWVLNVVLVSPKSGHSRPAGGVVNTMTPGNPNKISVTSIQVSVIHLSLVCLLLKPPNNFKPLYRSPRGNSCTWRMLQGVCASSNTLCLITYDRSATQPPSCLTNTFHRLGCSFRSRSSNSARRKGPEDRCYARFF